MTGNRSPSWHLTSQATMCHAAPDLLPHGNELVRPAGEVSACPYDEFLDAVTRMQKVDFPIKRDPAVAWPDFIGWRVNYEQTAYAVAAAIDAVPAM